MKDQLFTGSVSSLTRPQARESDILRAIAAQAGRVRNAIRNMQAKRSIAPLLA